MCRQNVPSRGLICDDDKSGERGRERESCESELSLAVSIQNFVLTWKNRLLNTWLFCNIYFRIFRPFRYIFESHVKVVKFFEKNEVWHQAQNMGPISNGNIWYIDPSWEAKINHSYSKHFWLSGFLQLTKNKMKPKKKNNF